MSARVVDKEAKRREILQAATHVVARNGIRNVRIADIARAAGIGKGTIYEYFSGKEEIYGEIIREYLDKAETIAVKKMFRARTPRDKITALISSWIDSVENESDDFMMLFLDVWTEGIRQTSPEIQKIFDLKRYFHEYRQFVASILEAGVEAGELRPVDTMVTAGSILAMCDGILLQWLLDRDNVDVGRTLETVLDIVWKGIGT